MPFEEDKEIQSFMEQTFIFRRLPIILLSSKTARELELNEEQILALVKIAKTPEAVLVSYIADTFFISTTKASRVIDSLVKLNLVSRVYAELEDRRKIKLKATESGSKIADALVKELYISVKELYEEIGLDRIKQLNDNLRIIN